MVSDLGSYDCVALAMQSPHLERLAVQHHDGLRLDGAHELDPIREAPIADGGQVVGTQKGAGDESIGQRQTRCLSVLPGRHERLHRLLHGLDEPVFINHGPVGQLIDNREPPSWLQEIIDVPRPLSVGCCRFHRSTDENRQCKHT